MIVDSGNGYHLYIPVNINLSGFFTGEDENENKVLWDNSEIKCRLVYLENLLKEFSNEVVEVDCISRDIARRVKVAGTWNVKEGISEDNYRISKIVESHEDALEDLIILSNTSVFSSFKPEEEGKKLNVYHAIPDKKTDIRPCFKALARRKVQLDGGTGHNLRHALLNELVACGYSNHEIHDVFKIQKDYKQQVVQNRINELRGKGKVTPYMCDTLKKRFKEIQFSFGNLCDKCPLELKRKQWLIEIPINEDTSATLKILGKNTFEIKNGHEVLLPPTKSKTAWFSSIYYRKIIKNALVNRYDLKPKDAERATNDLCASAEKRIKELTEEGAFRGQLNSEQEEILNRIKKVVCTRSDDGNIYNVYIYGEIIRLTDRQLYDSAREFCVQYLNRFFKKIVIDNEQWDEIVLPHLLSDRILIPDEDKIETKHDAVLGKFLHYIKNKKIHDWKETKKRISHNKSLFYDVEKQVVLVSSDFVNAFFEREKITFTYKISNIEFANFLREKEFLTKKRITGRTGDKSIGFWNFNPEKLGISQKDIIKEDKNGGGEIQLTEET